MLSGLITKANYFALRGIRPKKRVIDQPGDAFQRWSPIRTSEFISSHGSGLGVLGLECLPSDLLRQFFNFLTGHRSNGDYM